MFIYLFIYLFNLEPPRAPILSWNVVNSNLLNLTWTVPDTEPEDIDYYIIQLNNTAPPTLLKNTETISFIDPTISDHSVHLRAIDRCSQEGEELVIQVRLEVIPTSHSKESPVTTTMTSSVMTSLVTSEGSGYESYEANIGGGKKGNESWKNDINFINLYSFTSHGHMKRSILKEPFF